MSIPTFSDKSEIKRALQKLHDKGGTIHWRSIYSPLKCEEELFKLGYAKRDPIAIPGMDKKGATITAEGEEFLKSLKDGSEAEFAS